MKLSKRTLDIVASAVGLALLSPLLIGVAIWIWIDSGLPVLFFQERVGRKGRPFWLMKFRTMAQAPGRLITVGADPRITRVGHWLRRTKLDELPQLWNVLRGEMSLVGPRPLPLYEIDRIGSLAQRRRLSMKPGLTCLWQVSGRSQIRSFEEWVRLDLEYIDHWSLGLDFQILLRTVPVVLRGAGAR